MPEALVAAIPHSEASMAQRSGVGDRKIQTTSTTGGQNGLEAKFKSRKTRARQGLEVDTTGKTEQQRRVDALTTKGPASSTTGLSSRT